MKEKNILFERGNFWISKEKFKNRFIFKVWENGLTHAKERGTFDLRDDEKSFERAKRHIYYLIGEIVDK